MQFKSKYPKPPKAGDIVPLVSTRMNWFSYFPTLAEKRGLLTRPRADG